ncbi:YIP1 family protein [Bacillus aquiflavi]|uniref:Yip1 family protein n=1 Tax=Bacillus aquiflavi TaxID=2672567 RepID=UPI001CA93F50|nr:Yip1 family protein [Bacillus aquiflavi]UAC47458.1 YIP1 family protein [Bacillus aquiflavi]
MSESTKEQIKSPWITLWTDPRTTIQAMLPHTRKSQMFILIFLFGISIFLDQASARNVGDHIPNTISIFIGSIIWGILYGYIYWFIFSTLVYWTGKWIGGKGNWKDMRIAIAWSGVPMIAKLILWVPQLILFGHEMFTSSMPNTTSNPTLLILFFLFMAIDTIIVVWYYIITCKSIGQVHGFSAWKGLLSIFLSFLILLPFIVFILLLLFGI